MKGILPFNGMRLNLKEITKIYKVYCEDGSGETQRNQ